MAMPIKVMVTPTIRTNMPKEGITIIKHMAMVTTTRVMATMEMATVLKGVIPLKAPPTVKATRREDTTSQATKITVTNTTTRPTETTHEADVVIPRRTPRLSATLR